MIAGSTWYSDEVLLAQYINTTNNDWKYIIAPHEIHETHLQKLIELIQKPLVRYSQLTDTTDTTKYNVLLIDNIGLLSQLYQYGNIAYIGGGFGKGIHNTLEAATFGLPLVFGTNYHKFKEAKDLIHLLAATEVSNYETLKSSLDELMSQPDTMSKKGEAAKKYVLNNIGATDLIMKEVFTT